MSREAEHTRGPWEAIKPSKVGKHWKVCARGRLGGEGSIAGASVLWNLAAINNGAPGDTLDTEEANACLIAAAPELLAACEFAVQWLHGEDAKLVQTAIDKAKGSGA